MPNSTYLMIGAMLDSTRYDNDYITAFKKNVITFLGSPKNESENVQKNELFDILQRGKDSIGALSRIVEEFKSQVKSSGNLSTYMQSIFIDCRCLILGGCYASF